MRAEDGFVDDVATGCAHRTPRDSCTQAAKNCADDSANARAHGPGHKSNGGASLCARESAREAPRSASDGADGGPSFSAEVLLHDIGGTASGTQDFHF